MKRILEKEKNKLLLFLPLPFYVLVAIEMLFGGQTDPSKSAWLRFFSNILFLNAIHVIFTFLMIWRLPELQSWAKDRFRFPVLKAAVGVWLIFAVFLSVSGAGMPVKGEFRQGLAIAFALLTITWPLFHALWQTMGLSLAHHANLPSNLDRAWEKWERRGFLLVYLFTVARFVLVHGLPVPFLTDSGTWWQLNQWVWASDLASACLAGSLIGLLMIAGGAWLAPLPRDTKLAKACFLLRVPLFLLIPDTEWGFFAVNSIHGLEYLLIFLGMTEASSASAREKKKLYAAAGAGAILLAAALPIIYFNDPYVSGTSPILHVLAGATLAISYVHFLADRQLFRFRDPETRKQAGSLLIRP